MSEDHSAIYRQALLTLARDQQYCGTLDGADHRGHACNPLCGDELVVETRVGDEGELVGLRYTIRGCAIASASARLLAEFAPTRSRSELEDGARQLRAALEGEALPPTLELMRPLLTLRGHGSRHACVLLPWRALAASWSEEGSGS